LLSFSQQIQTECRERLAESDISMLPSYQHTLPTGEERGDFLALDVGGSTLRVALIRLDGKGRDGDDGSSDDGMEIRRTRKFDINEKIRKLQGEAFFDWMAARIEEMLLEHGHIPVDGVTPTSPLPMGLAWSFPVEQTSPRSGKLLAMGKGFCATHGVEGQDLSELIMRACTRRGLPVEMRAIVNDGAATLLAQTYRDPTTRMSLILGTGTNACVFLPVHALGAEKFGTRPESWFAAATHVLVNTELSMLGREALPTTGWDDDLNAQHRLPDFQPLEYLTTGRYLGEIVRLILLDAIANAGLFAGRIPSGLDEAYTLDTRNLAAFEADSSAAGLEKAAAAFLEAHPIADAASTPATSTAASSPSTADWRFVRSITRLVTHRAAAYLATALHALWRIRTQSEDDFQQSIDAHADNESVKSSSASARSRSSADQHISVACHGTIAEQYPGYRDRCQRYLDDLCGAAPGTVTLAVAPESSIFGAAVAVGCMEGREG
jgi:hexokinase